MGPTGFGRWLRALAAAVAATAVAALVAAAGSAVAGDSGTRLLRALPHYAAPGLTAGWIATALAAFHLRSLARNASPIGIAIRTAAHLCAPALLWLAAMHAGAWFEWQVRRTPIAYGTDWFYAEMYHEYSARAGRTGSHREHRGGGRGAACHRARGVDRLLLLRTPVRHKTVPLVTVLTTGLACARFSRRSDTRQSPLVAVLVVWTARACFPRQQERRPREGAARATPESETGQS